MRLGLLVLLAPLVWGCATPRSNGPTTRTPAQASGPKINSEDEYTRARAEYEALPANDPSRPMRRAALEAWILGEAGKPLDGGHLDEAWGPPQKNNESGIKAALTLYSPEELRGTVDDPRLRDVLERTERALSRRGAHEEVVAALVAGVTLAEGPARAAKEKEFQT